MPKKNFSVMDCATLPREILVSPNNSRTFRPSPCFRNWNKGSAQIRSHVSSMGLLVPYEWFGTYIVPKIVDSGYLAIGKKKLAFARQQ